MPPKAPVQILKGLLTAALNNEDAKPKQIISILLSVGKIMQIGRSTLRDKEQIRTQIIELVTRLNQQADTLPLGDISHTLYALVLLGHTADTDLTKQLVTNFQGIYYGLPGICNKLCDQILNVLNLLKNDLMG